MRNFISVKSDLHIVVAIAQHACDRVQRRILRPSTHRLQIFFVKYEYLRSSQLKSVPWTLAEFRHNRIVQSPHENYFNVCRQLKDK